MRAWVLLVEIDAEADRGDEVLRRVPEAFGIDAVMAHTDAVARLSLLFARALEQQGEDEAASEAYGEAAKRDPRCSEVMASSCTSADILLCSILLRSS